MGEVLEARVLAEESEARRADRAVALLADDDLGHALFLRVRVVDLVAVDEQDEVGILLDRARLAKVRHHRPLVRPLLERAIELRERHHRHAQLLRQRLHRARDLGDLGRAVLAGRRRLHQLEIIDDHEPKLAVRLHQASRARAHLDGVQCRRLVDQDRRLVQAPERRGEPLPVLAREPSGAKLVLVEPAHRADQPQRELRGAHFHREHGDGLAGVERDVLADVQREGGLAHRRASCDDDEVAGLQARGHPVDVGEARGHAGHVGRIVAVVERLDALDDAGQELADLGELLRAAAPLLGDVQHLGLGLVEDFLRAAPHRVVCAVGDVAGGRRELAQDRAVADDLRVMPDVRGGGNVSDQRSQIREPADVVELLHRGERLGHGDDVGRLALGREPDDLLVDDPVGVAVEIRVRYRVADAVDRLVVEQEPAQHRLLRLERMRRELQGFELQVVGHGRERGGASILPPSPKKKGPSPAPIPTRGRTSVRARSRSRRSRER